MAAGYTATVRDDSAGDAGQDDYGLAQVGQDIRYASSNTWLGRVRTIAPSGTPVGAQPNGSRIAIAAFDAGAFTRLTADGQTLLDQIIATGGQVC